MAVIILLLLILPIPAPIRQLLANGAGCVLGFFLGNIVFREIKSSKTSYIILHIMTDKTNSSKIEALRAFREAREADKPKGKGKAGKKSQPLKQAKKP